jgi:hypothetical protein
MSLDLQLLMMASKFETHNNQRAAHSYGLVSILNAHRSTAGSSFNSRKTGMFEILLSLLLFSSGTAPDLVHELTFADSGGAIRWRKVRKSQIPTIF